MSINQAAATASEQPAQQPATGPPGLSVIGIGASAGGLAALRAFFAALPERSGLTFVVVVHLSPEHESVLATLLQPYTAMPVTQVTARIAMQPDHVYVIPPGKQLVVADSFLDLADLDPPRHRQMQIDAFFRSLTESHGDGGAVILSGSGSDGAVGIQAIKEKGGLLLVQSPEEAEYDGMPRSAIATGLVDIVAPAAQLATQLVAAKQTRTLIPLPAEGEQLSTAAQSTLTQILAQLRVRTGHDFSGYKPATVLRRIARRMQITQLTTLTAYLQRLRQEPQEAEALFRDLLINVTEFFRDPDAWAALESTVIPQLFTGKGRDDRVRVWSVGCATGEEAYSIAMLLLEYADALVAPPTIQVFASDLGQAALDFAREGCYPEAIADNVPEPRLARFFAKENSHYRARPELRESILFTHHNLLQAPPFSRLDLILCRNLLIYIQRDLQEKLFETFYYALRPEGYLFLGNAESAEGITDLFETVDKRRRIYQRRPQNKSTPILPSLPLLPQPAYLPALGAEAARTAQMRPSEEHRLLLEAVAPPSILVDRDYNVLHLSETVGRYLLPPGGAPTVELLKLVRPELQSELRGALLRAFDENHPVATRPIPVRFNGAAHPVYLMVRPHHLADGPPRALVIFLEDETPLTGTPAVGDLSQPARQQLETELRNVQSRLQSMREEYETSVEELRAANEELQSTNEEYKSTLEELETSKEELQSVNEELHTINQELKNKIDEVTQAHNDQQNLFIATDIATLFLDRELRVKRYTPRAVDLFNLMPPDRGRPIAHLRMKLHYEQLEADAQQVLTQLIPVEREVQSQNGRWFLVRVRPYRTLEDRIDGVVITFVDITANKANEAALRNAKEYAESIVYTIPDALLVLTPDLRVQMANNTFYETFQVDPAATEGRLIYELGNGQWNIPTLRTLLEEILPDNRVFIGYEVAHTFQQIGRRTMLVNGRQLEHAQLILLAITDITERKQHEQRQAFLLQLSDALRPLSDAVAIQGAVTSITMAYFGADRCYYCEIEENQAIIRRDVSRADLPSVVGVYPLNDFPLFSAMMNDGLPLVVEDTETTSAMDEALRQLCLQMKINSFINVPVIKNQHYVGNLCLTQSAPRNWGDFEVKLIEEIAERTWTAVERAHVEEALRKSEEKYRTLFDSIDEGYCLIEMIFDEAGEAVDARYLETNPVFEQQTGIKVAGKLASEIVPDTEKLWFESLGEVARTGNALHFENYHEPTGRWYSGFASRVGGANSSLLTLVFADITERKRREANLAFLAEINTDFATLTSADAIINRAGEKLARYLGLSRCDFSIVDEEADRITVFYDWRRDAEAPSVLGEQQISTFLTPAARQLYAAGELSVINDIHHDPRINAPPALMDALQIRAVVDAPYLENGRWRFLLSACRAEATVWRADEIELISELAARIYLRHQRAQAEEQLHQSEEYLRLLIESARDYAIMGISVDGRIETWNTGAAQVFGWSEAEIRGEHCRLLFTPEDRAAGAPERELATAAQTGQAQDERWHLRKDGSRFYVSGRTWQLSDEQGNVRGFVKIAHDLTHQKVAEEALRASEERLRLATEAADMYAWELDLRTGTPKFSDNVEQVTGRALTTNAEENLQWVHPADHDLVRNAFAEAAAHNDRFDYEMRAFQPDNQIGWYHVVGLLMRDQSQTPVRAVGVTQNITARKQAEAAMREAGERLQTLIENLPGGAVFVLDRDLRYRLAGGEALYATGFTPADFVGKAVTDVLGDELAQQYEPHFRQALTGTAFTHEHDAHGHSYISRGAPLYGANGDVSAVLVVSYDITDRKQAEAALQHLNATLEQQVDTRTAQVRALASELTMAEQEERRRISQILHDDLQQLLYGMQMRMMAIMNDLHEGNTTLLTDYAREVYDWMGDAIQTTRRLTVDISPPVLKHEGLADTLRWLVTQMRTVNGLQVDLHADGAIYVADEDMRVLLFQIVRELLFNVVKHAQTDRATVALQETTAGEIMITIGDQGRGFDVAAAMAKDSGGFGLFSVNERLKLFGGRMAVQSAPTQGTRIILYAPIAPRKQGIARRSSGNS